MDTIISRGPLATLIIESWHYRRANAKAQPLAPLTALCSTVIMGGERTRGAISWLHAPGNAVHRHRDTHNADTCRMVPECSMNKCLQHWLNKGNFPHIYSSAVKLHGRRKEPGFGFPPLQHNHWESCSDPRRCGEPAAFHPAGARMVMCQEGWFCQGRDGTCSTHAPSDTSLMMV